MSRSAAARRLLERALQGRRSEEPDGPRLLKVAGLVDSKGRSDAVMTRLGIRAVATLDRDFAVAGFTPVFALRPR